MNEATIIRLDVASFISEMLVGVFSEEFPLARDVVVSGEVRRQEAVISSIHILISAIYFDDLVGFLKKTRIQYEKIAPGTVRLIYSDNLKEQLMNSIYYQLWCGQLDGTSSNSRYVKYIFECTKRVPILVQIAEPKSEGLSFLISTGPKDFIDKFINLQSECLSDLTQHDNLASNLLELEMDFFREMKTPYIDPSIRGYVSADEAESLVKIEDICGLIHIHSNFSDGKATLEQICETAISHGFQYITITDHAPNYPHRKGIDENSFLSQRREIERLKSLYLGNLNIIHGVEIDIEIDGDLNLEYSILSEFEFIIASIHEHLDLSCIDQTQRLLNAVKNPLVSMLGHPTGRSIGRSKGITFDYEQVFKACASESVALEINCNPARLDIDVDLVKIAKKHGCQFFIGNDMHSIEEIDWIKYGVSIARKSGLSSKHILNASENFTKKHSAYKKMD